MTKYSKWIYSPGRFAFLGDGVDDDDGGGGGAGSFETTPSYQWTKRRHR